MEYSIKGQENSKLDQPLPLSLILLIPVYAGVMLAVLLLPAAGTWGWLEGWLVIGTFAIGSGIMYAVINSRNPRVLRNRMKTRKEGLNKITEKPASSDRVIGPLGTIFFLALMLLAGFNQRFGWSQIPLAIELVGLVLFNIGYLVMGIAMEQNAHASKMLDINQDQALIDTGLYSRVRHPLYTGASIMILALAVALGFWWSLVPAAALMTLLVIRIHFEEQMLLDGMDGYREYQERVRYKLIPGIY